MKKLFGIFLILLCQDSVARRAYGLITIGTGWTSIYQRPISDWIVRNYADFLVQTKGPYVTPRSISVDDKMYNFYHIPIGILQSPALKVYIAPGTIIDLELLKKEIKDLESLGVDTKKRIRISSSAQILMPYEKLIGVYSRKSKMSTVARDVRLGIGIAGADKCMGVAFRVADLMSSEYKKLLKDAVERGNKTITKLYEEEPLDIKKITKEFTAYRNFFKPYIRSGVELKLNQMLTNAKIGVFDSPYGTYLDGTHGTVLCTAGMSSLASSICSSAGIGINRIKSIIGITDPFTIYPGSDKIISQITDSTVLEKIKKAYDKSYKKDFQYGWLDLVLVRQAVMINGIDCLAFNGLHMLDDLDEIKLCVNYELDGRHLDYPAPAPEDQRRVTPHYISCAGWKRSTKKVRSFGDLPQEARIFLKQIEILTGVPVALASVGSDPHEMVVIQQYCFPK